MNKADLLALKEKINTTKEDVAKLNGKLEHLMGELKTQYKCKTVEDAKKKSKEMTEELEQLKSRIYKATEELEAKYDIN